MAINFDNRVSWMDIVAIVAAGLTALTVFFGVSADVGDNRAQIEHIQTDVRRIEVAGAQRDNEVLDQLKENRADMKEIRHESAAGRKNIIDKLDRLIERQLDNGNAH